MPDKKEAAILLDYWKEKQTYFTNNKKLADKTINVGQYKPVIKDNTALAALMQVIQVIYNMEEAITKT